MDAQGPVLVSADGKTLTFPGVPDPAWMPGDCTGNLTVALVAEEQAGRVAVHFHLRSAPHQGGGVTGSCAVASGILRQLPHALGSRALTDSQGRPLRTVAEADLPRPRDPDQTEQRSELCVEHQLPNPSDCLGSVTLIRHYLDTSRKLTWSLSQSLDAVAPDPTGPADRVKQRTVLNGVPAVCVDGAYEAVVEWTEAGTAQELELDREASPDATIDQLCTQAFAEAGTVR
ncbi:hypothetical protein ACFYNO_18405 [Kitasatospora sp. NPDC006697]|uniref:hypothetical protein n=1 Tax=Kitasatospora sp. NPDC006697 TaxID=3364020 RepID=UPI00368F7DF2